MASKNDLKKILTEKGVTFDDDATIKDLEKMIADIEEQEASASDNPLSTDEPGEDQLISGDAETQLDDEDDDDDTPPGPLGDEDMSDKELEILSMTDDTVVEEKKARPQQATLLQCLRQMAGHRFDGKVINEESK